MVQYGIRRDEVIRCCAGGHSGSRGNGDAYCLTWRWLAVPGALDSWLFQRFPGAVRHGIKRGVAGVLAFFRGGNGAVPRTSHSPRPHDGCAEGPLGQFLRATNTATCPPELRTCQFPLCFAFCEALHDCPPTPSFESSNANVK